MPRVPNPRGRGGRLRSELLEAALRLVDTGGAASVTLRAVSREAGVSAPSVYRHFANLDELIAAAADGCFAALSVQITAARDARVDVVERLLASCAAYLDYAKHWPERYGLMFGPGRSATEPTGTAHSMATFDLLVDAVADCVSAGRSTTTDATLAATAIWSGLDGYANLRRRRPHFPWPPPATLLSYLVSQLAAVGPVPSRDSPRPPSPAAARVLSTTLRDCGVEITAQARHGGHHTPL